MTTPISQTVDTLAGRTSTGTFITLQFPRDPTPYDGINNAYQVTQRWVNSISHVEWFLQSFSSSSGSVLANWYPLLGGSGIAITFDADTGSATQSGGILNVVGYGTVTTSGSGNTLTITGTASGDVSTLTGNSGGPVGPASGNINVEGDGTTINVVGNPGTNTLTISTISGGGAIDIIDGDSGSVTGSTIEITGGTSGAFFTGSGTILTESFNYLTMSATTSTDGIIIIKAPVDGMQTRLHTYGNYGSSYNNSNIFIGSDAGNFTNTGAVNTGIGSSQILPTLGSLTSGSFNVGIGGGGCLSNLTSGDSNTAVGSNNVLYSLITGTHNTALGFGAGQNYTGSESSNILIENFGILGESNVLRIGTQGSMEGQQNSCYIAGITGVTVASPAVVMIDPSTGQLGQSSSGSFSPGLSFGGDSVGITYTSIAGNYTTVGNMVFVTGYINLSNKGSSTGAAKITGLPINVNNNINFSLCAIGNITLTSGYTTMTVSYDNTDTTGTLYQSGSGETPGPVDNTSFANDSTINFSGFYNI